MRLYMLGMALLLAASGCAGGETAIETPGGASTAPVATSAPELVEVEASAVDRFVKAGTSSELVVRIRLDVDEIQRRARPPVNVALAVDTSGSMDGEAIAHAREACLKMVDALADGDRVAIVTFDTRADALVPSVQLDKKSRALVRAKIRSMQARGTTDLAGGLSSALGQVLSHRLSDGINRIVLLGDGVPNDPTPLAGIAQQAKQNGVAITSLGLGLDYDETLMGQIAEQSGGKFHYVDAADRVATVLENEVLKIERVAGRNATLTLVAGPGVIVHEVVGHSVVPSPRMALGIGELVAGETRDIVVRLTAPAHAAGAVIELLDAELVYQDALGSGATVQERGFVAVRATESADELKNGHDAAVELSAARAAVAALVVQAIATARAGNLPEAQRLVDRAEKHAREQGRTLDDAELLEKAAEMTKLRKSLATLLPPAPAMVPPTGVTGGIPTPSVPSRPPSPADAAAVREAHSAAVETLQGG